MAGEDPRYTNWVRTQPCAACSGPGPCEPHHALSGTTYSPDETRPAKAIPNARKGKAQRAHDHFAIPLHTRCHAQFHRGTGLFSDMSPEQRDKWESDEVRRYRTRYACQCPTPAATATSSRTTRKRIGSGWTVATIRDWLRKEAPTRPAQVADALTELANLIEEDTL